MSPYHVTLWGFIKSAGKWMTVLERQRQAVGIEVRAEVGTVGVEDREGAGKI
jgi:hypothetical protein